MQPTESELVDAWVTLSLLHDQAIHGLLTDRRFDTPTACSHAKRTIEIALELGQGPNYQTVLWEALDERRADTHE